MYGPHEDSGIIFGPNSISVSIASLHPLYHNLVELIFLLISLSHALSQHSVTCTKNFLSPARPTSASQMWVSATRMG